MSIFLFPMTLAHRPADSITPIFQPFSGDSRISEAGQPSGPFGIRHGQAFYIQIRLGPALKQQKGIPHRFHQISGRHP